MEYGILDDWHAFQERQAENLRRQQVRAAAAEWARRMALGDDGRAWEDYASRWAEMQRGHR